MFGFQITGLQPRAVPEPPGRQAALGPPAQTVAASHHREDPGV